MVAVAVTPMILPEEFKLNFKDIEITATVGSGKGGQHRNRKKTAARVRHLPTNTIVLVCNEREFPQNQAKAIEILASKLKAKEEEEFEATWSEERRRQMGGGSRSGKIRTYNFIHGCVTDHNLSRTSNDLRSVMKGRLDLLIS